MPSRCRAPLKPLSSESCGRTVALFLDDFPRQRPLQGKRAPGLVRRHFVCLEPQQQQVGHNRDGDRAFDTPHVFSDLMLTHAHDALEFSEQQLCPPPAQVDRHDLTRTDGLGQIGHQQFGLFRPVVVPTFAQDKGDVSQMPKLHAFGKHPEGAAPLPRDRGQADALVVPPWQMRHQRFETFAIFAFPAPGNSKHVPVIQGLNETHIGSGGLRRIGHDDHFSTPRRRTEVAQHLPEHGIFGLIVGSVFAPHQGKVDRNPVHVPVGQQHHDAKAEDVGMGLTEPGFVGHGMLGAAFALERAVGDEI